MESKAIPTAEQHYFSIIDVNKIPTSPEQWLRFTHEYAVLFAKYHRLKAIEEIKEKVEQSCIDMNLFTELDIIINSIENAYSEDEIK